MCLLAGNYFSHQMSLHAPLVNKEDYSGTNVIWKNAHLQFVTLVFINLLPGVGFTLSQEILCFKDDF